MAGAVVALKLRTVPVANKNGLRKDAPAVHKLWTESRRWAAYMAPGAGAGGEAEAWLAMARAVEADLTWLLRRKANSYEHVSRNQPCGGSSCHLARRTLGLHKIRLSLILLILFPISFIETFLH